MEPDWQTLVVLACVALAAAFVAWRGWRLIRPAPGKAPGCGTCDVGCGKASLQPPRVVPLVQIAPLGGDKPAAAAAPVDDTKAAPKPAGGETIVPLLLVVALALGLRLGMVAWRPADLGRDPDLYRALAETLVAGEGFIHPRTGVATAYRPPLYPLLLAGLQLVSGSPYAIGIAQAFLGAITAALTCRAAHNLGHPHHTLESGLPSPPMDGLGRPPSGVLFGVLNLHRASLLAGLLVACDPLLLQATTQVMTETLAAMLTAGWLWMESRPHETGPGKLRFVRPVASGFVLGLALLCRPTYLVPLALWFAGATLLSKRNRYELLVTGALAASILLPWTLRNAAVMGAPVVLTTHGGYTLLLAHNETYYDRVVRQPWGTVWDGESLDVWQARLDGDFESAGMPYDSRQPFDEVRRDRRAAALAWNTIRERPADAARSGWLSVRKFWNLAPLASGRFLPGALWWGIALWYLVESGLLLIGLLSLRRKSWRNWLPALAVIAGFTLVHAVYWSDMRMRGPIIPAIALLAAASLASALPTARDDL